jgi:SPP1 gp7 family putative phage head morphogenesis protein
LSIQLIEYDKAPKKPLKLIRLVDPSKTMPIARELGKEFRKVIKDLATRYIQSINTEDARITSPVQLDLDPEKIRRINDMINRITADLSPLAKSTLTNLITKSYAQGIDHSEKDLQKGKFVGKDERFPVSRKDDQLMAVLEDTIGELITSIQGDFRKKVKQILVDGFSKGRTTREITGEIKKLANTSMAQAERIARTEIIRAYNLAAKARYEQAGVEWLVWQSSRRRAKAGTKKDQRTCEICDALHGRVAPIGQPFARLKGKEIRLPPDPHPNCRCTVRPITTEQLVNIRSTQARTKRLQRQLTKGKRVTITA